MRDEDDEFCRALLQRPNRQEALSWVCDTSWTKRSIGELSHEHSVEVVKDLYGRGAVKVVAVDLPEDVAVSEFCDTLVVVLPDDVHRRNRVLELCSCHALDEGFGPIDDEGQKTVFLWWD
jgi:hypothetical protein